MIIECNKCHETSELSTIESTEREGMDIRCFTCPKCGRKYISFAADAEMNELISERKKVEAFLRTARLGNYRTETIKKLIRRRNGIERRQKALMPKLTQRADEILNPKEEAENGKTD